MTQKNIKIVGGPGKFELMLALFEGKEITFSLEDGTKEKVRLNTIQREDGSSQSWNLDGYSERFPHFWVYYTTRRNQGVISLDHPLIA